jgi:hypothetical protein
VKEDGTLLLGLQVSNNIYFTSIHIYIYLKFCHFSSYLSTCILGIFIFGKNSIKAMMSSKKIDSQAS